MTPVPPDLLAPSQPYRVPQVTKVFLESQVHLDQTVQEDIQETPDQSGSAVFRAIPAPQGCPESWDLLGQGEIPVLVDFKGNKEFPEKMEDQGKLVARAKSERPGHKDLPEHPVHPEDLAHRAYQAKPAQWELQEKWEDREIEEIEEK